MSKSPNTYQNKKKTFGELIKQERESLDDYYLGEISPHTALGLLIEEFEEVKDELLAKNIIKPDLRKECSQLAAICSRIVDDIC